MILHYDGSWTSPESRHMSLGLLGFVGILSVFLVTMAVTEAGPAMPLILLAICYLFWSWRRPVVAVSTIIILFLHILDKSEGISAIEVVFGLYFFGYILFWFATSFFRRKQIIVQSVDSYLIAYILICFLTSILNLAEGGSLLKWFREFLTVAGLVFYFPVRDALKSKKDVHVVCFVFLAMVGFVAIFNLVEYRVSSLLVRYTFELLSSRQAFGSHYFVAVILFGSSLFMNSKDRQIRRAWFAIILISWLALALTFSRGFWFGAMIGMFVLWIQADWEGKRRILSVSFAALGLIAVLIWLFAGHLWTFILEALLNRFVSSGSGLEDLSLAERAAESRDMVKAILQSPVIGHGFGATYSHYNTIDRVTVNWFYGHNAFLFLLFKVGILGTIVFFGFYFSVIKNAWRMIREPRSSFVNTELAHGVFAMFIALLLIGTNSGIFIDKSALLIISVGAALVTAATGGTEKQPASESNV